MSDFLRCKLLIKKVTQYIKHVNKERCLPKPSYCKI